MKALVLLPLLLLAPAAHAAVVVEEVGQGSALESAGLRAGDTLLAWERQGRQGEIQTPFDWLWLKTEQAPRGNVRLLGERDGEAALSFDIPKGLWDAKVRPGTASKAWDLFEAAAARSKEGKGAEARADLEAALEKEPDPRTRAALLEALAESYQYSGQMARAEAVLRSALEEDESLQTAGILARLGNVVRLQSRLEEAAQLLDRALKIRERLAPDGLEVADSLHHLAMVAFDRGEPDAMSSHLQRALAILEGWPPDCLEMANIQSDLALQGMDRGRYSEAAAALQRALDILDRRAPGSIQAATSLGRLGFLYRRLGDNEATVEALQRALAIRERLAPASLGTSVVLSNLGLAARERGDLDEAKTFLERALAIAEKAVPDGVGVSGNLYALGTVARLRGDLDEAWKLHQRALELARKLPNRYDEAAILSGMGLIAEQRDDLEAAIGHHQQALGLLEKWAPASIEKAEALHQLGKLHRRLGRLGEAARLLDLAVGELESGVERVGGSHEMQATLRAGHEAIYREAIAVELERGHPAEAFHLLERSRARSFLTLLAERDIVFAGELPAGLERSRRDNAAAYDRVLRELARTPPEGREALDRELLHLRQERARIAAEIREASPRLAALRQPQPLDLDGARKVLDPGTLALSYSVGKDRTTLFAVTREGGLQVTILPVGEEQLRREVESFLDSIRSQQASPTDLYRELIGPVASLMESSERVLILPDGPLHRLPFGALDHGGRFLVEEKPLHTALSLTVYGTLRGPASSGKLVAFGDPRFPKDMQAKKTGLGPGLRSFDWSSLPYSRSEVEQIAGVNPGALVYLGEEATEERAKSIHDARILHFATHGYTDDRTPLDSALVLTIPEEPGRENGLLQVWEIFEGVRIDADLVVLSACESALGREQSGEGLIGLTRAFQYAGARSVAASLWSVADQVTAELMARFHRHLAAGLSKDRALRAAQLELIREPIGIATASGQTVEMDASAPFYWAAFQLFGDWKSEDPKARVAELEAQAERAQYAGQLAKAEEGYRAALEAGEAAWGESLQVAGTLARLGNVLRLQSRLHEAARIQEQALKIRERLAPDSLEVTDSLHQLFLLAWEQKDMDAMAAYSRRAMTIQERFPPDTLAMADTLNDLAMLASEQGRYAETEALFRRAVTILEKRSPDSIALATSLGRLGLVTRVLGDAEAAEEDLRRALAIRSKLAPASLGTASILANLGGLARERGDLETAAQLLEQSLAISEKAAPTGPGVTSSLNALGIVERLRGNLDRAWELHQRALKIREQHPGRYDDVTNVLGLLGNVAEARGDRKAALELYQGSLASAERLAPGEALEEALALQQLGRLHHRMGRSDLAAQLLARAVDTLESQTVRLGNNRDLQATFRGRYEDIYLDAMEAELARQQPDKAFHLLERSRARSFLALLAERDLAFGEVPEELERSRRDVAARYDRKLREMASATGEAKETLQRELDNLRLERDGIAEKIRAASPRLAALREPQPLTLEAARKVLDPGTLALSYSVGKDKTILFALTREGSLQVKTLPLGGERLRREIESFLEKVRSQQAGSADLYRELIGPVADLVERSERVLIVPDGPLHRLPFGALAHDGRFLIEEKPLHTALSLTVYGTLRASAVSSTKLVAFGDPRFPKSPEAKSGVATGLRGFDWESLPYSRSEVERIAGIHPGALLYLGEEATEERAKSIHDARILHFATHGLTNDRTPLDSALVLTIPEKLSPDRDNGLLQVWEIFESVRLDTDLVVLSACESALGRELSGEGLIGLTRAFQYAGARSVAASLWSVADQVTAELMARFHRHLAAGLPKDQALRAAQLELIREPLRITAARGQEIEMDASAPFFWAAFQLFGDWK